MKVEEASDAASAKQEETQEEDSLDYDEEVLFLGEQQDDDLPGEEDSTYESPVSESPAPRVKLEPSEDALLDFSSADVKPKVKAEPEAGDAQPPVVKIEQEVKKEEGVDNDVILSRRCQLYASSRRRTPPRRHRHLHHWQRTHRQSRRSSYELQDLLHGLTQIPRLRPARRS